MSRSWQALADALSSLVSRDRFLYADFGRFGNKSTSETIEPMKATFLADYFKDRAVLSVQELRLQLHTRSRLYSFPLGTIMAAVGKVHPSGSLPNTAPAGERRKVHYPFWFGGSASCCAAAVTHPLDLGKNAFLATSACVDFC